MKKISLCPFEVFYQAATMHAPKNGLSTNTKPFQNYRPADDAPIEAVSAPISSLHRRPNLMAQRFFQEITWKARIFPPHVLNVARSPCGVTGRLLLGSIQRG